uniref:Aminoglycoside phosphotransferase domain-containing protein n=1 Tax=Alexandrium monilatum TaxID=311494 RepID=A0A7S4PXI7_9DINO|mmetsp:Transcript_10251/g.30848  ORF Transcript_10251/g.30848 Transcript_10251/m.30848 type:complete len:525 (-) Transcript_10251:78-1652(-)
MSPVPAGQPSAAAGAAASTGTAANARAAGGSSFRERVEEALRRCVPGSAGLAPGKDSLVQMSGSASNFLYRVDVETAEGGRRRLCLRCAQHAQFGIPHSVEADVMRAAREQGAVVPEVCGVLPPGDLLGSGFFMAWVEGEGRGEKIAAAFAEHGAGSQLGRQCGETLARIQSIGVESLPPLPVGPPTPLRYLASLRKQYDSVRICRPALEYTFAWLEAHAPAECQEERPVLVHGDFRSANIMAHPERGLAGVIDWELVHLGNRYEDIGWICVRTWRYGMLHKFVGGFAGLSDFCKGYEAAGGAPVDHAMVWWWALAGSVRWSILCLQQGANFRADSARFENGVVGRRACEGELDCLITIAEAAGGVDAVLASAEGVEGEVGVEEPRRERMAEDSGFPAGEELVLGAQRLLSAQVLSALTAAGDVRNAFLVRVVNNALGMVARSLRMGPSADRAEAVALARLLGPGAADADSLSALRRVLAAGLRSGQVPLERPGLLRHLLVCTGRQALMDQPKYASLATLQSKF